MLCHMPLLSMWNRLRDNKPWKYFLPLGVHALSLLKSMSLFCRNIIFFGGFLFLDFLF